MQSQYIIAGFTDIKSELRIKTRTSKDISELHLWFTFQDDVLYVHDYSNHKRCAAIALCKPADNDWQSYLNPTSYGNKVVKYITGKTPLKKIAQEFNYYYKLYGFSTLRRR